MFAKKIPLMCLYTLKYCLTSYFILNRNLSSAKQNNRQAMRRCRGLVDSLVNYIKDCVEAGKPDDKVKEREKNTVYLYCMLILHSVFLSVYTSLTFSFNNMHMSHLHAEHEQKIFLTRLCYYVALYYGLLRHS